jgi:hypothetical protein
VARAQVVLPAARAWRVTPSAECPWRPERDLLAVHEAHKKRVHDAHWRARACARMLRLVRTLAHAALSAHSYAHACTHRCLLLLSHAQSEYSDKAFYSEAFLDTHMERRHMDKIPPARAQALTRLSPPVCRLWP